MKIALSNTIRELERRAHAALKINEPSLMEQASRHCARHIFAFKKAHAALSASEIIILAGRGNNGGDGILTAAYLSSSFDEKVTVYSMQSPSEMSDEIRRHFFMLPSDVTVKFIKNPSDFPSFNKPCIIVDALLGIGFKGELRSPVKELIELVNSSNHPVISIDIPSGIECDSGCGKEAVFADMTVTIGTEKAGLYINDGRIHSGIVNFADIGFDISEIPENEVNFEVTPENILQKIYRRPKTELYKNINGRLLIIGGSCMYPGALVLAVNGAASAGCGLLTAALKARPFANLPPDVIVRDFSAPGEKCFNGADVAELFDIAEKQEAVVFGCGVTANSDTAQILRMLLGLQQRLVLDADALNLIAAEPEIWQFKKHSDIVLTPHTGEAKRLANAFKIKDFDSMSRPEQALSLARTLDCTVVLKGSKTVIASADGRIWVNQKGSAALAKGGSGDILSGITGAMLAKHHDISVHELAAGAVMLHSSAADFGSSSAAAFNITALPEFIRKYLDTITIF